MGETRRVSFNKGARIEDIYSSWDSLKESLSLEQKKQIVSLYIICILGLKEKILQRCIENDLQARCLVRRADPSNDRLEEFWQGTKEILPQSHNDEDVPILVKAGWGLALSFMCRLRSPGLVSDCPLFRDIVKA